MSTQQHVKEATSKTGAPSAPRRRETIVVTGAAGFIGSSLVDRLLQLGNAVIGIDNFDPYYDPSEKRSNIANALADSRFLLIEADCANPVEWIPLLDRQPCDAIVHLAAKCGVRESLRHPVEYVRANVLATQAILAYAQHRDIRRIVLGSSSSVYGNTTVMPLSEDLPATAPISPYAASKRAAELLCSAHHNLYPSSVIALRFFTVYGPRQRPDLAIRKFASRMLCGEPIDVFGDGFSERDYTWIGDIVNGITAAIRRTEEVEECFDIINLGSFRGVPLRQVVDLLADSLGVTATVRYSPAAPGDVLRTCADLHKASEFLGYKPEMTIEEGVARFAAWFRARQ